MINLVRQHPWNLPPREAIALQRRLAPKIIYCDLPQSPDLVAGVDVGLRDGMARAAVAVLSFPGLELVESVVAACPIAYPYVPGLLTFREAPAILDAMACLSCEPDLFMFDGQGYAHPRRMGLATHLGILLDRPTIGVAKSRLTGHAQDPGLERGSQSLLMDGGEVVGAMLRTRTKVRPLYISVGHRARLSQAIELVLACHGGVRLPEPTRWAHRLASSKPAAS